MEEYLEKVIRMIGENHRGEIWPDSRHYREISIGRSAERLGYSELKHRFREAYAIVPLKRPADGMKVRIDGRTFVNYAQFDSGVVVPGYLARLTDLPFKAYTAKDSMILNIT
jgi:hypothetical protein